MDHLAERKSGQINRKKEAEPGTQSAGTRDEAPYQERRRTLLSARLLS